VGVPRCKLTGKLARVRVVIVPSPSLFLSDETEDQLV